MEYVRSAVRLTEGAHVGEAGRAVGVAEQRPAVGGRGRVGERHDTGDDRRLAGERFGQVHDPLPGHAVRGVLERLGPDEVAVTARRDLRRGLVEARVARVEHLGLDRGRVGR